MGGLEGARRWVQEHVLDSRSLFVYALSVCIISGKHVTSWNNTLVAIGLWPFIVVMVSAAIPYFSITANLAEMISIVPFSGGVYGYVRCTLGPTLGYITGVMEGGKYILYTSMSVYLIGVLFQEANDFPDRHLPLVWLGFFIFAVALQVLGRRAIWWAWGAIAIATFMVQLLFIFGAMGTGREENLRPRGKPLSRHSLDGREFLLAFPAVNYLFTGLDAVRTCATGRSDAAVPAAIVQVFCFTLLVTMCTIVSARAYVKDLSDFSDSTFPFSVGLQRAFPGMQTKLLPLFALPGLMGTALGFNFAAGRQARSMAGSGLLPAWLGTTQKGGTDAQDREDEASEPLPVAGIVAGALLSFGLLLGTLYEVERDSWILIVRMGGLLTIVENFGMMTAFIVFATRFSSMERHVRSPVGIPGAVLAMLYVAFCFNVTLRYDQHRAGLGLTLLTYFGAWMAYYYLVVQKRQFFSKEEQDKFMKAYVVNANKRKRIGGAKSSRPGSASIMGVLGQSASRIMRQMSRASQHSRGVSTRSRVDSQHRPACSGKVAPDPPSAKSGYASSAKASSVRASVSHKTSARIAPAQSVCMLVMSTNCPPEIEMVREAEPL